MLVARQAAAARGPEGLDLGKDELAQKIAGTRERERRVRVKALELGRAGRSTDPELERRAFVAAFSGGERPPDLALLRGRPLETRGYVRIRAGALAPTLDAACRLEPRHSGDEVPTRQVVGRRKRLAVVVVGRLLRDGGLAERAAPDDAP